MNFIASSICVGEARPFRNEELSAFAKQPVSGPVAIGFEGLEGDQQADRIHHGGPEMAVHLYPLDHHEFWRTELGGHDLLDLPGAFGSNLSVAGIDEENTFLGDRFRLGTALLEVSQPRLPCWKIEHRFGRKGMVAKIIKTGRCGWYFRVIEEGTAQAGDELQRVESNAAEWTIGRIFSAIVNPKTAVASGELTAIGNCELLAPKWREGALQKAAALGD